MAQGDGLRVLSVYRVSACVCVVAKILFIFFPSLHFFMCEINRVRSSSQKCWNGPLKHFIHSALWLFVSLRWATQFIFKCFFFFLCGRTWRSFFATFVPCGAFYSIRKAQQQQKKNHNNIEINWYPPYEYTPQNVKLIGKWFFFLSRFQSTSLRCIYAATFALRTMCVCVCELVCLYEWFLYARS